MKEPLIPSNEEQRIKDLHDSKLLDTPIEPCFERITRLAQKLFDIPIVAISLVDDDRQWFKSIQGLDVKETPRKVSFCGHTILSNKVMIIENTLDDLRFHDNPLVIGEPNIRFYAGCPITSINEQNLGTLCLIDNKPRCFNHSDILNLTDLSAFVEEEIKGNQLRIQNIFLEGQVSTLQKISTIDQLTQLWNRTGMLQLFEKNSSHAIRENKSFALCVIDIDNFKCINDDNGHNVGDLVIKEISGCIVRSIRNMDFVCRWGGDEFIAIINSCDHDKVKVVLNRLRDNINNNIIKVNNNIINCTVTIGVTIFDPRNPKLLKDLVNDADKALFKGKESGRNDIIFDTTYIK